jgi:hypothetical protein
MGRHRNAKLTIEECRIFDISSLKKALYGVSSDNSVKGVIEWPDPGGRTEAVLGYWAGYLSGKGLLVLVEPELTRLFPHSVRILADCVIPVTTTRPSIGGFRFWFRCPIEHNGKLCGRRVKRLNLPPGEQVFGCRQCYNLTYESCQKHDNRVAKLARDPEALDAALKSEDLRRAGLGIDALMLHVKEMQKHAW